MENFTELEHTFSKCMFVDKTKYLSGEALQNALDEIYAFTNVWNSEYISKLKSQFEGCNRGLMEHSIEDLNDLIDVFETIVENDESLVNVKMYLVRLKIVVKLLNVKVQFLSVLDVRSIIRSFKNNIKTIVTEEDSKINFFAERIINFKIFINELKRGTISKNKLCAD
ncbi:hypothetical protein [Chryseobacterium sp. RLHN22]|uniref:hypothetical protein n=1 Tax=Chryseobacterium sp. RLHN22 TaxID=3437885 RepID=UPI003D9BDE3F